MQEGNASNANVREHLEIFSREILGALFLEQ